MAKCFFGETSEQTGQRAIKKKAAPSFAAPTPLPLASRWRDAVLLQGQWMAQTERAVLVCVFPAGRPQEEAKQLWVPWAAFWTDDVVAPGEAGRFATAPWVARRLGDTPLASLSFPPLPAACPVAGPSEPTLRWWPR